MRTLPPVTRVRLRPHPARRSSVLLLLLLTAGIATVAAAQLPQQLAERLEETFGEERWEVESFGPTRWLDGGEAYTTLEPAPDHAEAQELVRYDTASGERSVLISAAALTPSDGAAPLQIEDYSWSPAGERLLLFVNSKKVWRRNTRGDYWVLDLETARLRQLGRSFPESTLMFAKFTPDGAAVGYVQANDLYVEDLESHSIHALTTGGSRTQIHGTSDWVYEEELGVRDGFRFSPDSKRVAFWELDSAGVGDFALIDNTTTLYPKITNIPYPKVGTTNSAVRIGIRTLEGNRDEGAVYVDLPGDPRENYVARIDWLDAETVILQYLNRLQNRNDVLLANAATGAVTPLFRDENDAWLDIVDEFVWIEDEEPSNLLWLSERGAWRHAYRVAPNGRLSLLTDFDADVIELVGLPTSSDWFYFLASPADATRRALFRAPVDGSSPPERVTPAEQTGWHSYDLAPNGKWAIQTWSSFDRPPRVELVRLPSHEVVRKLADNEALEAELASRLTPPVEFFDVEVEDGVTLDAWRIVPPDFDPQETYPLLVFVYGEPAGQTVLDRWAGRRGLFHRALAEAGWVVVSFDNRGTPAPKGTTWRKVVYGEIGVLSASDQAAAVKSLLRDSPYLDPDKVAIWGWSGGGSNTLNALFRYPEVFKVGVSIAPVPDQRLYDTIYQERYMGLPEENEDGYRRGSPIHFAEGLEGRLLLVHGTGDDNVHYQGTERLVNRLIELGKDFDLMVYPNRSHSISEGSGTTLHVYRLIARYLLGSGW